MVGALTEEEKLVKTCELEQRMQRREEEGVACCQEGGKTQELRVHNSFNLLFLYNLG